MYQRIRSLREDRDLKQRQLAEFLNCSQRFYSNYELGQRDIPTDVLNKLSNFYNVSVDYLLGLTANPKRNKKAPLNIQRCFFILYSVSFFSSI